MYHSVVPKGIKPDVSVHFSSSFVFFVSCFPGTIFGTVITSPTRMRRYLSAITVTKLGLVCFGVKNWSDMVQGTGTVEPCTHFTMRPL